MHSGFCSAIRLELREELEMLECTNEYNLGTKPLSEDEVARAMHQVQMLKEAGVPLKKFITMMEEYGYTLSSIQ